MKVYQKKKNRIYFIIWCLCCVNAILLLLKMNINESELLNICAGWTAALNLFSSYIFLTGIVCLLDERKKRNVLKYLIQFVNGGCNYVFHSDTYMANIKVGGIIIILLNFIMAITLTINMDWETYYKKDEEYRKNSEPRLIKDMGIKTDSLQKINIPKGTRINKFSMWLLLLFVPIGSILSETWKSMPQILVLAIFWSVSFILLNKWKYNYFEISKSRFWVDVLGVCIGMMIMIFLMESTVNLFAILLQIYCCTPYILSFLNLNKY